MEFKARYPNLAVDLSKANYLFGVEGRIHGQMKLHGFPKSVRREFTVEIQQAETFEEQVSIARRWVTVLKA